MSLYGCCSGDSDCASGECFNIHNYPVMPIPEVQNMICTKSCKSHTDCPVIGGSAKCGSICTADIAKKDEDFLKKIGFIGKDLAKLIPNKCIKVCEK